MNRKVYIVSNGGHDYSDAKRYGELVFLTDEVIRKDDIAQMYRVLSPILDEAEADDLLLISSLTSLCVVATAILSAKFGEIHLLLYKDGRYEQRDLILDMP